MQKKEEKSHKILEKVRCDFRKSVFAKLGNKHLTEQHNIYTYNFYMLVVTFLITAAIGIPTWNGLSLPALILAVFYGVFLVLSQVFLIRAMNLGDTSVSTLFYSSGFLIPIFASVVLYDEKVSVWQGIGVLLMLISFLVTVKKKEKAATLKWFLFIVIALLCNGILGTMQKVFGMSPYRDQQSAFMIVCTFVGMITAFLFMPKRNLTLPTKGFLKTAAGSGLTLGIVNAINVYVSGVLPGVIVFPCVNGGGVIASAILARIIIGEKITLKQKIGIAIGVTAICFIAL